MFTSNPFAGVSAVVSPSAMQMFVIAMFVLVVAGTIFDVLHKRSARYFFENWKKSKAKSKNKVSGGQVVSAIMHTALIDVLTSGEFCNVRRRIAHLLTMYGFVAFVVSTAVLVFCYPTDVSAAPWTQLWHIGAAMVCVGGYWFWFFIRVDVAAEGNSPFRIVRADLFVLVVAGMYNVGTAVVLPAARRPLTFQFVFRAASFRGVSAVWFCPMVKICTHVLQAGSGSGEAFVGGQWHKTESPGAI